MRGLIIQLSNDIWLHPLCVTWNPNVSFKDDDMKAIKGMISRDRIGVKCYICMKTTGASVECDMSEC